MHLGQTTTLGAQNAPHFKQIFPGFSKSNNFVPTAFKRVQMRRKHLPIITHAAINRKRLKSTRILHSERKYGLIRCSHNDQLPMHSDYSRKTIDSEWTTQVFNRQRHQLNDRIAENQCISTFHNILFPVCYGDFNFRKHCSNHAL